MLSALTNTYNTVFFDSSRVSHKESIGTVISDQKHNMFSTVSLFLSGIEPNLIDILSRNNMNRCKNNLISSLFPCVDNHSQYYYFNQNNRIHTMFLHVNEEEEMKRAENFSNLKDFSEYTTNWNGYNADAFDAKLISEVKHILQYVYIQPSVFPTARDSIQLEYEKDNGEYLEFEIYLDRIEVFRILDDKSEQGFVIDVNDILSINKVVYEFYGSYI